VTIGALFARYDWGHPIIKAFCFLALAGLVALAVRGYQRVRRPIPARWLLLELLVFVAVSAWALWRARLEFPFGPAHVDIGKTTEAAAVTFFGEHANPYRQAVAPLGGDARFWGFKYGPVMFLVHPLAALWPQGVGLKIVNVASYLSSAALIAVMPLRERSSRLERVVTGTFVVALFIGPGRIRYELLHQGVVDPIPVLFLVASLAALERRKWGVAGFLIGISISAKVSPGVVFLLPFLRRGTPLRFLWGVLAGLVPLFVFGVWDHSALLRNMFLFHALKPYDTTSLMSVVPTSYHWLFLAVPLMAGVTAALNGLREPATVASVVSTYLPLMVIGELCYREMHINHLFWFIPFVALRIAQVRDGAWGRRGASQTGLQWSSRCVDGASAPAAA
jgi:hypothetical protein